MIRFRSFLALAVIGSFQAERAVAQDPQADFRQARLDAQQAEAERQRLEKELYGIGVQSDGKYKPTEADISKRREMANRIEALEGRMEAATKQQAAAYNRQAATLSDSRVPLALKTDAMNAVISSRNRDELDKSVDNLRRKWRAEYGQHIGVINAFDGTSYYKYYDERGNLVVTKVRGDYELLKRQHDDWMQEYKRAQWALETVNGDIKKLEEVYDGVVALKARIAQEILPPRAVADDSKSSNSEARSNISAAKTDDKAFYLSFLGDGEGGYGAKTLDEALAHGRRLKELNPDLRVRITGPVVWKGSWEATNANPGPTVLDLP